MPNTSYFQATRPKKAQQPVWAPGRVPVAGLVHEALAVSVHYQGSMCQGPGLWLGKLLKQENTGEPGKGNEQFFLSSTH